MRLNERYELREHGKVYTFFNTLLKNPYFLIAPAVIFDLWLTVYPMCFAIYMSFYKWDPISGRKKFLGLGNFRYLSRWLLDNGVPHTAVWMSGGHLKELDVRTEADWKSALRSACLAPEDTAPLPWPLPMQADWVCPVGPKEGGAE